MSDISLERKAKIRRLKANFVIEENVDAIKWPAECSACGGLPQAFDEIRMEKKYKNFGLIKTSLSHIPYCENCFKKVIATKRLDKAVWILALIFGIPLGLFLSALMANEPGAKIVCLGLLVGLGVAIAWGIFWLIIRFPIKSIFKNRYTEHIDAWIIEEKKSDQTEGLSVVVSIPNKTFAQKFANLNGVGLEVSQ
ncbi:MAG: hypothetical protein C0410_07190 [Anaerolinea sp.]|nr:hypothetical protein [Anaerolinea sp.]